MMLMIMRLWADDADEDALINSSTSWALLAVTYFQRTLSSDS